MRLIVCGGRHFQNKGKVYSELDRLNNQERITVVITGDSWGVETWAVAWCTDRVVPYYRFPANWVKMQKAAGPIRNRQMFKEGKPTHVIAFKGGKGTANPIKLALKFKIPLTRVTE